MAQKCCARILGCHAAAVIQDADEGHAAVLDFYGDARCARVDGVFHQLLDNGSRPLDHFARGDQICDMAAELDNFRHGNLLYERVRRPKDMALMSACSVMGAQMVPPFS